MKKNIKKRNKKAKITYPCKICNNIYDNIEMAEHCSSLPIRNNNFVIGDYVLYEKKEIITIKRAKKHRSSYYNGEIISIDIILNKNGASHCPIYKLKYCIPTKDNLEEVIGKNVEYYNLIPIHSISMGEIRDEL